ncbi:hypothetical protein KAS14_06505 [Candidatus Bathyarchaeota archaeon]|nr:hypothetical protein [Candidatus Bathyarchaeota archaeon]
MFKVCARATRQRARRGGMLGRRRPGTKLDTSATSVYLNNPRLSVSS